MAVNQMSKYRIISISRNVFFFKYVNKTLLNHWKNPKRGQILVDWISKLKCEIMRE